MMQLVKHQVLEQVEYRVWEQMPYQNDEQLMPQLLQVEDQVAEMVREQVEQNETN